MAIRIRNDLTRRRIIASGASAAALAAIGGIARPSISRAADRPLVSHGVQSGDVSVDSGDDLGARRPSRPDAGRDRHHRQLQEHPARRLRRRAAGKRFHRQGADRRPARRAGHLLSRAIPGSRVADHRGRAGRRPVPHRAGRPPLALVRLVGRHRGPGLGHRRVARRHARLRHDAAQPAGFLHPHRRHHLRRRADRGRAEAARTAGSGRTSSPRRSRSRRKRSPSSAATTNTICSTRTCAPSTPKFRCSANGTTTRSPTTGGRASRSRAPSISARNMSTRTCCCWRRAPAAPSTNTCRCARRRPSPAASTARSPTVRCSTSSCSTCAATAGRTARATRRPTGPTRYFLGPAQVAWLKRELVEFARHLEGDRRRHAARADRASTTATANGASRRSPRATGRRAGASSRSPTCSRSSSTPASAIRCG